MADQEKITEAIGGGNGGGNGKSVFDALKTKELLLPAALSAVGAVAAAKGPDLVRRLTDATEEKSEESAERLGRKAAEGATSGLKDKAKGMGVVGKVASKVLPGGGGGGGGGKKTRRLPIQRWTDVAVPVEKAYEAWIKFDEYPKFMHRVLSVEQKEGEDKIGWQEKIWFSKRQWEGKITERRKNDRIVWKTTQGTSHKGIVSFHRIDDNLTRVMVEMEFQPTGMMEKMASGLRFVKRAVQADLARFKAYVEMSDAKGLDYAPVKGGNDDKDEKKDEKRDQKGEQRGRTGDDSSKAERDDGRSERESRRRERQKSGATS